MKKFVVKTPDEKLHIIGHSGSPSSPDYEVMGLAPQEAESAEDLELVTETDEMGMERTHVKISEVKRAARLEREAQKQAEQEAKDAAKELAKKARKDKAKAFDANKAKLKDVAEMVQAIAEELGLNA